MQSNESLRQQTQITIKDLIILAQVREKICQVSQSDFIVEHFPTLAQEGLQAIQEIEKLKNKAIENGNVSGEVGRYYIQGCIDAIEVRQEISKTEF